MIEERAGHAALGRPRRWLGPLCSTGFRDLIFTLDLLCTGSLAGVFDGATSHPIDLDAPAVSVDISAVKAAGDKLLTAAMLCTWSYGFGCVDAASALAGLGAAPARSYLGGHG